MIGQLVPATLFCSFSSAETQWIHLLRILGQLVGHKEYTDEEISNFNWDNRGCLIAFSKSRGVLLYHGPVVTQAHIGRTTLPSFNRSSLVSICETDVTSYDLRRESSAQ